MKKITYKIVGLFSLITLLSACNKDFLDLKPLDQEVTTSFYKTEDQAIQALVAVYDVLGYPAHRLQPGDRPRSGGQ